MGARQSKRSVDITTTPKKEGIPVEGGVVGDAAAPGDGKLERIEEADTKPTTNGIAPHTDTAEDKEKDKDEATEKDKEQPQQEEVKAEETKQESSGESPAEVAEVTTPTEATPASPNTATSPDNKETKKKDKKKKWSFRSISFSKKDKTKPSREEAPKNGDVTKEEPLAEGGEEAENATADTSSPEEKSAASSPSADEQVAAPVAADEPKEESAAASPAAAAAAASPVEEKKEEPTPSAPTPVPSVEDKKEETVEKVEAEKKVVEVSQSAGGQSVTDPVEVPVYRVQPVATPSIIERKTSEDLPSLPPSSPPPTPIDPSPLQQARQAAASATALAEALKLPAVAAGEEESPLDASCDDVPQEIRESAVLAIASPTSFGPSADLPPTEATFVLAEVNCSPVVEAKIEIETSQDVAKKVEKALATSCDRKEVEVESKVVEHDTRKQLVEPLDSQTTQKEDVESKAECPFIPKEIDSFVDSSVKKSDSQDQCSLNINNEKPSEVVVSSTVEKVMNEPLPVVECQIKSEINSCEGDMKINVLPNTERSEKVEIETLPSTEIEIKGICPIVKQHLSSENFEIETLKCSPSEVTQHVESIEKLSDLPLIDKGVAVESEISKVISTSSANTEVSLKDELKQSLADVEIEGYVSERSVEYEHDYAKYTSEEEGIASVTSPTELFINSEEGPLSVSEDILVEAKLAMIIPEDDSVEELSDTTDSIKVIPDTDEEKIENEPELDIISVPDNTEDEIKIILEDLQVSSNSQIDGLENVTSLAPPLVSEMLFVEEPQFYSPQIAFSDNPATSIIKRHSGKSQTQVFSPEPESLSLEDLPPAPEDTAMQSLESFDYPLPPEELSCPLSIVTPNVDELPVLVEHAANPREPTHIYLTPPLSPNLQSNVNIASGIATETTTRDCSQIPSYDDNSNREQPVSLSESMILYDQSDIELKQRLAAECLATTESQEGVLLSCELSHTVPSTASEEHHQKAPEIEAPVENNIAHDVSTTESVDEAPKVAPPAIPTEAPPASPPTAPAITEDVASVTKAIEEIDISDKAVAAAVNEAIECNTNEIIADAHHQNNINE
ncbi:A-kinase anchor protein 200-like [Nylanderia fulva]|uniref:A-kinase anchor protein 200-like n=1 Tax=Nylanderia fulva TaxID=613905 RepID=UPI0010FB4358|nr:A-kinase anchor protein 200-like [Nylanderia fulva]